MPPFVNTECAHCKKPNRFDLAELRKGGGSIFKGTVYRQIQDQEEFEVTCQHCGRKFKILMKGVDDDKEN